MEQLLTIAAATLYLVPVVSGFFSRGARRSWLWVAVGGVAHLAALARVWIQAGRLPLDEVQVGLSALALWIVAGWFYLRLRPRMELLGRVLLVSASVMLFVASLVSASSADSGVALNGVWFPLHVLLMITGFSGFALSFATSGLYLWVRRRLKQRRLAGIGRLPSLDTLDRLNLQAMALGFVALSAGMVVGVLWARTDVDVQAAPDVTTYATGGVWLWYAAGLYVRLIAGWRGRLASLFGVLGMGLLVVLFALAALLLRGWHGFGG